MKDQANSNEPATSGEPSPTGTVLVDNIHDFVAHLNGWHSSRVQQLRHMIEMPEGISMVTGEGAEEKSVLMQGDMLAGFKAGIELALMQLGTLPFGVELEDDEVH